MSVLDEQQSSLPTQPKGVSLVITRHDYNPANGHYEPWFTTSPTNDVVTGNQSGSVIFVVPTTVNARWVYGVVGTDAGSGGGIFKLWDSKGPYLEFTAGVQSGGTYNALSTPQAPLFVLPAGDSLINIDPGNPISVNVIYVDK